MYHVLLVDHYDSFTDTLKAYFVMLGCRVTLRQSRALFCHPFPTTLTHIVLSPGPGHPNDIPQTLDCVRQFSGRYPLLGVCLGHQCIATVFGGHILTDQYPTHGKTANLYHHQTGLFAGLPQPFQVMRYHSLHVCVHTFPPTLTLCGWTHSSVNTPEKTICMALTHKTHPTWGIQFHPESILTAHGHAILTRFLRYPDDKGPVAIA